MFLRIKIHLRLFGDFFSTHFCSVRPESYTFVRLHEIQFAGNLVTYGVCWWTIVAGELSAGLCYKRTIWLGRRRENYSYVDSCVTNAKIELERSLNPAHFLIPAQLTSQGVKWAWMLDYSVLEKVTEAFGRRPSNSDVVKAKVEGVHWCCSSDKQHICWLRDTLCYKCDFVLYQKSNKAQYPTLILFLAVWTLAHEQYVD